ncbi:MAG: beta-lactamase family protein [Proteobacteria bacterium]|nr:beta-lactamase family protein [Pseudomonadota bacterium]
MSASIEGALADYVREGKVAGVAAMVRHRGRTIFRGAYGCADLERQTPLDTSSIFRIASMTKPVTSVAALMLLDDGVFRLDDPITQWLPEFEAMTVLVDPVGDTLDAIKAARAITVQDLLTQRSGLAYPLTSAGALCRALREIGSDVLPELPTDDFIAALGRLPLMFQPGQQWYYGFSTDVLGILVGRAVKSTFPDFLRERLFDPLGMKDTGFQVSPEKLERLATAYIRDPTTGSLVVYDPPEGRWSREAFFPSGGAGLVSTLDDYMAFAEMLTLGGATNGRRYLKEETFRLFTANALSARERAMPFMGIEGFWASNGFGLGVSTVVDPQNHPVPTAEGQIGWPGAFGTSWFADSTNELTGVLMFQEYWSALPISFDFQAAAYTAIA